MMRAESGVGRLVGLLIEGRYTWAVRAVLQVRLAYGLPPTGSVFLEIDFLHTPGIFLVFFVHVAFRMGHH